MSFYSNVIRGRGLQELELKTLESCLYPTCEGDCSIRSKLTAEKSHGAVTSAVVENGR
jgi:hypothetical protein